VAAIVIAAAYFLVLRGSSKVSLEIWVTKGEDPQARYSTMTSAETENARVWVKGPGGTTVSFQVWVTFPSGEKATYGPGFQTDPAGNPVNCGGFASALFQGTWTFEVMIDNTAVGSTTLTVT